MAKTGDARRKFGIESRVQYFRNPIFLFYQHSCIRMLLTSTLLGLHYTQWVIYHYTTIPMLQDDRKISRRSIEKRRMG